uniref:prostaglandin G/H synthase 2 isoform X1 n=1 Tax=Ciona intestinalis TaxID=7719 RepID=UPI000180C52F|nr:prostaglandin G/H synthase 2 isoform X1 [Ciona intestinalis]|eukprot:XP_002127674.1 prostaglandin G/H synthase 2 isoform X1 [Ciona intestinalis]
MPAYYPNLALSSSLKRIVGFSIFKMVAAVTFLGVLTFLLLSNDASTNTDVHYDPCCSFPCQHQSVCTSPDMISYQCDCTGTGYYGDECQHPYLSTRIKKWIKPSKSTTHYILTHFKWVWTIVNNVSWLRKTLMKAVLAMRVSSVTEPSPYRGLSSYPSWSAYINDTMYVRTLPPVPTNCPTPMGVKGKPELPEISVLLEKFFKRRTFQPCPQRTSVLFPFFAQHFTHMFFKTDPMKGMPYQWGDQLVDLSQIYGHGEKRQHELRSHVNGKLKVSLVDGHEFPPLSNQTTANMSNINLLPQEYQFVFGHQGFSLMPTFLIWSTIWLREHNRICDLIKEENPAWDDERIFQTARLVLTGETIKVVIEDYVQHLSGFHYKLLYDPELVQGGSHSFHNQIHVEFQLLYHWHALMPDQIEFNGKSYTMKRLLFNPEPVVKGGLKRTIEDLSNQWAGQVAGGKTQGAATLHVAGLAIKNGRDLRMQSFNAYKEKFEMKKYTTFQELTGEEEMAAELQKLYGDIDAVEYYIGIMLEKRRSPQLFGETLTEMGSPYSLKGLYSNPINHKDWWKPSTFGGQKIMDVIKNTNLQSLICRTVEGCPHASFTVPDGATYRLPSDKQDVENDRTSAILIERARNADANKYMWTQDAKPNSIPDKEL